MKGVLAWRVLPVLAVLALSAFALVLIGRASSAAGAPARLPDLVQQTPRDLEITRAGTGPKAPYVLGFRSAVSNIGDGALVIEGHRRGPEIGTMIADQVVDRDGAPKAVIPDVGRLRYVVSPDHRHWHLLGFDRYELRRAGQRVAEVRDQKTGFCLGDRYVESGHALQSAAAPAPVFTSRCGLGEPQLLGVGEGISVGYGDDYAANLEGQYLRLTGLAAGRYVLVHRVNADRRLHETDYGNDAASLLLELRWRNRQPLVRILRLCPGTDRCDRPPAAKRASAGPSVRTVATGLEVPWDIAFLPDGSALVTERPGRVRLLGRDGRLRRRPVARVAVSTQGEGGLLGLAVDPDFAHNRFVYLYSTTAGGMRLERRRYAGGRLTREQSLVDGIQAGSLHDSGRIAFGPDGRLYVATGDAGHAALAQRPDSLNGKFLALTPDQYRGPGGAPQIVSRGHRNPQGFDWEPGTGRLIATEHGPTQGLDGPGGFDEINTIVPGGNYGWPVKFGLDQSGFNAPLRVYPEPLAPSGATFVTRPGSAWTGSFVFACLRGQELRRLTFRDGRIVADEALLRRRFGRLRTVVEGPDGDLYVLTSNRDGRGRPTATPTTASRASRRLVIRDRARSRASRSGRRASVRSGRPMADHPQPRLLRVFLGDATPPPRGADAGNGNGASPGAGARSAVTVSEGIDAFLAAVDDRSVRDRRGHPYSRPTARDLRWCLAGHVREALGPMRLDAVRRADVEALVAELADEGVSERRCRAVARAVRALYDDAVARGLAEQNPAAGVVAAETGPDRPAVAPAPRASPWERALSLVLRAATAGLLLLALVFLTESL